MDCLEEALQLQERSVGYRAVQAATNFHLMSAFGKQQNGNKPISLLLAWASLPHLDGDGLVIGLLSARRFEGEDLNRQLPCSLGVGTGLRFEVTILLLQGCQPPSAALCQVLQTLLALFQHPLPFEEFRVLRRAFSQNRGLYQWTA